MMNEKDFIILITVIFMIFVEIMVNIRFKKIVKIFLDFFFFIW